MGTPRRYRELTTVLHRMQHELTKVASFDSIRKARCSLRKLGSARNAASAGRLRRRLG